MSSYPLTSSNSILLSYTLKNEEEVAIINPSLAVGFTTASFPVSHTAFCRTASDEKLDEDTAHTHTHMHGANLANWSLPEMAKQLESDGSIKIEYRGIREFFSFLHTNILSGYNKSHDNIYCHYGSHMTITCNLLISPWLVPQVDLQNTTILTTAQEDVGGVGLHCNL